MIARLKFHGDAHKLSKSCACFPADGAVAVAVTVVGMYVDKARPADTHTRTSARVWDSVHQ